MKAAGCKDETVEDHAYEDLDGQHTTEPDEVTKYKSEPPSSGATSGAARGRHLRGGPADHRASSTRSSTAGSYLGTPGPARGPARQFKALYEEDPYHVIMLPREELKEPFAVSAWVGHTTGHILRCQEVNDEHLGRDPRVQGAVPGQGPRVRPVTGCATGIFPLGSCASEPGSPCSDPMLRVLLGTAVALPSPPPSRWRPRRSAPAPTSPR